MLKFALNNFPQNAPLKDLSGLPWCVVTQPFLPLSAVRQEVPVVPAAAVARCAECFAYINPYVRFESRGWRCNLCEHLNPVPPEYKTTVERARCPELRYNTIEADLADPEAPPMTTDEQASLFLAVIDLACDPQVLENVKQGILSLLEALPPFARLGIMTFSDSIGVYDLESEMPHVRYLSIPASDDCALGLDEIFPQSQMFVSIGDHIDQINMAVDSLTAVDDLTTARRGFGTTISAIVDMFEDVGQDEAGIRALLFLGGYPNYGMGVVDPRRALAGDARDAILPETPFYRTLAERSSKAGVCMDMFVVSAAPVDLASIKFLSYFTGGNLSHYPDGMGANVAQDVFRQYCAPFASHALLRIRTSPEFQISRSYGHLFEDDTYDNVMHITGCDQHKTFAFDFEFTGPSGFPRNPDTPPTVQLVFAYTTTVPPPETDGADNANARPVGIVRRRLRIHTIEVGLAYSIKDMYQSVEPENVLALLTHKLIRASLDDGVDEARLLLRDWTTILMAHYNEHAVPSLRRSTASSSAKLDLAFNKYPSLQLLSRLVFGLSKSPLLRADGVDPDKRISLQLLYSGLAPSYLVRAVYPALSSYSNPNLLDRTHLFLSRHTVVNSSSPILFLDAFSVIVVYYGMGAAEQTFPPPHDSLIMKRINTLKRDRQITPVVHFVRAGSIESRVFDEYLIEELDSAGHSYGQFLELIAVEVQNFFKE